MHYSSHNQGNRFHQEPAKVAVYAERMTAQPDWHQSLHVSLLVGFAAASVWSALVWLYL